MAKIAMDNERFHYLISALQQETDGVNRKLDILFRSEGEFNHEQAAIILYQFGSPMDKIRAIEIMERRLCRMSSLEARDIIGAVSINSDKLRILHAVKGVISDLQTKLGEEHILSCFPYESDKFAAKQMLGTVHSDLPDVVPAGGHQGYAALGCLYTQARPVLPHLYGSVEYQQLTQPGQGQLELISESLPTAASIYTSHPSYAYPPPRSYIEDRGYPGTTELEAPYTQQYTQGNEYPAGAPPLGYHSGAPAPTGFYNLEPVNY